MRSRVFLMVIAAICLGGTICLHAAKPEPKFPASTWLCGIESSDSISKVKKMFGPKCKKTTSLMIYNDPKYDARISIEVGGYPRPTKRVVLSIHLTKGRIKGKYFASKPFAHLGDRNGITLGSGPELFEKTYGQKLLSLPGTNEQSGTLEVDSPPNWYCTREYDYKNGKLVGIYSGFSGD